MNDHLEDVRALYSIDLKKSESVVSNLFKLRPSTSKQFTNTDMFHIPFELKHIVGTNRYSMKGVPCIYLGTSAFICWHECGKLDQANVQFTRFELKQDVKVVNFSYSICNIKEWIELINSPAFPQLNQNLIDLRKFVISWFKMLPLMIATSIRKHTNSNVSGYVSEYVIPQMLLKYVRNDTSEGLAGIRYLSTQYISNRGNLKIPVCFAFPTKTNAASGHCDYLKSILNCTDGQDVPTAMISSIDSRVPDTKINDGCAWVDYRTTIWGKIESELFKLQTKSVA